MNTKSITLLLATAIVLTVYIVGLPSPKPEIPVVVPKPTHKPSVTVDAEAQRRERRRELQEEEAQDSTRLTDVLIEARKIADEHAAEGDFEVSYTVGHEEEGEIIVEIQQQRVNYFSHC